MATAVLEREFDAPISLYLDIEEGVSADIEAVSRAAIAWAETIREAAFLLDPTLDVRVELVSGTRGSLSLNAAIASVKRVVSDPKELRAVGYLVAIWFAMQVPSWVAGKGIDAIYDWTKSASSPPAVKNLSDDQKRELATTIGRVADAKSVQQKAQRVYAELYRDSAVKGVGISFEPGKRPLSVVPRSEFPERSGQRVITEEVIQRRTEVGREVVTLESANLTGEQKWKFKLGSKSFWATMDDPAFNARLQPGSNRAPRMIIGIRMEVAIETVQELKNGVWANISHRIVEVFDLREPQAQPDWLDAPREDDQP